MSTKSGEVDKTIELESTIVELKLDKSKKKAAFTRLRNRMLTICLEENTTDEDLKETLDKVESAMDDCVTTIQELVNVLKNENKIKEMKKMVNEIEVIENLYEEMLTSYQHAFSENHSDVDVSISKKKDYDDKNVNSDMYKQLKRVSIPVFKGKIKDYEFWKSAFFACVDSTNSSDEYKFLQLRQYLEGEALNCVEGLGHSAIAYKSAKERLERKYGGKRRKVNRFIEDIDNFPAIRNENAKLIEKFSDLLDIAIINMKEDDTEDLGSNFVYLQLLKKLPESMITRFIRWIHQNDKSETVEVLKDWVLMESQYLCVARETKNGIEEKNDSHKINKSYFADGNNPKNYRNCVMCTERHQIWDCEHFKNLSVAERWQKAKELKLCFRCLRNNHLGGNCRKYKTCEINGCTKVHNKLLHQDIKNDNGKLNQLNENAAVFTPSVHQGQQQTFYNARSHIALRTVPVLLKANGKQLKVNALLDDGSTKTYVNRDLATALGLQGDPESVKVNLLNGTTDTFETMTVNVTLESCNKKTEVQIDAFVVDNVTGSLKTINWNEHSHKWEHLKNIQFPVIGRKSKVDILIGLDYAHLHSCIQEIHGEPGEPIARLTPLGWTCVGQLEENSFMCSNFFISDTNDMSNIMKSFWEVDSYATNKNDILKLSKNEQHVLKRTEETMKCTDGHYEVQIPWKKPPELPNNHEMAVKRLESTCRKLLKNPYVQNQYGKIIENYQQKGYLRKVPEKEIAETKWFLPHFPVVRLQKETTKVRIVFDASAKFKGLCLNDFIEIGPKLQNDLFDVLLRFRKHKIAVVCDISEMYMRVGICEPDRKYHRILWNDSVYEFTRVVFGVNASPFLAQLVSQMNARKYADIYPEASETVLKSTYMDDSMDSVKNEQKGIELYHQLSELWSKAGMYARKWMSNSVTVLEQIPESDRAAEINLETRYLPQTKALGVTWRADTDMFTFSLNKDIIPVKVTKRNLLKAVASMFDPLGFISPYVVTGKILMQKMWLLNYDWDDEVDVSIEKKIMNWVSDMSKLNNVTVPRCLSFTTNEMSTLHTFVDASEDAYSAVSYVHHKSQSNENIEVLFVSSKTRVAPLESTSIPRLELMAAILGLRLAQAVGSTLQINENRMIFWTDSTNVLYWITGQSRRYKPFVANRIGEIHENSIPTNWRHVPSEKNPADVASRGLSADKLLECTLWWNGPDFLYDKPETWPTKMPNSKQIDSTSTNMEIRRKYLNTESYTVVSEIQIDDNLDPCRFSSWMKMIRVFAWVNRFITNCRSKCRTISKNVLSTDELLSAENSYISLCQQEMYPEEYRALKKEKHLPANSRLLSLNVKLDSDGIMKCDTRLKYSKFLPYSTRFPIVLPRRHRVTKLIVKYYHELGEHCGTNQTLASLSTKYWIVSGREEIREFERECTWCKRLKVQTSKQIMAPLPQARTEKTLRAFAYCSVDFGGPFLTKQGRGKARLKRYLCLFTCLSSRAVHLEMAMNLDTDSFINCFYRMTCRRGIPKTDVFRQWDQFCWSIS